MVNNDLKFVLILTQRLYYSLRVVWTNGALMVLLCAFWSLTVTITILTSLIHLLLRSTDGENNMGLE